MKRPRPIWLAVLSVIAALVGCFMIFTQDGYAATFAQVTRLSFIYALFALVFSVIGNLWTATLVVPVGLYSAYLAVARLETLQEPGGLGYWLFFCGFLFAAMFAVGRVSLTESDANERAYLKLVRRALPPVSVPLFLLLIWQGLVVGNDVPKGIFPSVTDVYTQLVSSWGVLLNDSYITFIQEVLFGFAIGFTGGFLVAVAIAYSPFLQKGFLPLAAAFGAVPIVGLAPVLGRAFGVDWESKAAVVVIVTFFPVVLNTVQGLLQVDPIKLELLRAYAASPRDIFFKLRLPNALPYIFNALKLASVLSVVSVIVAEFLIPGPPRGLGQRISLSARQGAFDVVFAAIVFTSVISVVIYGALSVLERFFTGWHPSFREN